MVSEATTPPVATLRRHLALIHPHEPAVALRPDGAGLPCVEEPLSEKFENPGAVPDYAGGGAGALPPELAESVFPALTFLCCLGEVEGAEGVPTERLYLCEAFPDSRWQPELLAWWNAEGPPLTGLPDALKAALHTALECRRGQGDSRRVAEESARATPSFDPRLWARGGLSPLLPAFIQPGFTTELAASLAAEPERRPLVRIGERGGLEGEPLQQLRTWSLSSVWASESYVLKLPHPVWHHEAAVTKRLAELEPDHVAAVVASGTVSLPEAAPTGWFLQERLTPASTADEASRVEVVLALAKLQRSCRGLETELLSAGLLDRGPAATAAALELVWRSPELDSLDERSRLLLPELDALLRQRFEELERLEPPLLLCHGDLHLGNVIAVERGVVIIDWTDASLSWPGVDLVNLIGFSRPHPETPEVLEAYACALDGLLPNGVEPERLIRQGMELAHAFQAVSYATIEAFRPAEVRWEMEGVVRELVSLMLARWFPG